MQIARLECRLKDILPTFRWFGAKSRTIKSVRLAGCWDVPGVPEACLAIVKVEYADSSGPSHEKYLLPLIDEGAGRECRIDMEVLSDDRYCQALLMWIFTDKRRAPAFLPCGRMTPAFISKRSSYLKMLKAGTLPSEVMGGEQTNTSIRFGKEFVLKLIRKVENCMNLDVEVTNFLTGVRFRNSPQLAGALEIRQRGVRVALASVTRFIPNNGDAWCAIREQKPNGEYSLNLKKASLRGKRTFEMHESLSKWKGINAPEKLSRAGKQALVRRLKKHARGVFEEAGKASKGLPVSLQKQLSLLFQNREVFLGLFDKLIERDMEVAVMRIHGDYHMGQVLNTGRDFIILDFEGEPARPPAERRRKQSPLRDVGGLLRSIHYAVTCTVPGREDRRESIKKVSEAFLRGYFAAARKAAAFGKILPADLDSVRLLIDVFVLEKALYELMYEINHRPDWVHIPLSGLLEIR